MMKLLFLSFKKELFVILALLSICSIVILPLLHKGLPPTHDGEYHVIRGYQFDKTLRDGDWYPRWLPDLNYGYGTPLLNYYYPLPYYVMSLLHFLGASFIDAFKLGMLTATLTGAIFLFLWVRMFWGNSGGFVASIFYTFAPYHISELYVRGSAGEVWSLAFFPAFLWSITKLIKEGKYIFLPISALFLALIIFSHNILAIMFLPFALSYMVLMIILSKQRPYTIRYTLYAIFLGLGFSAIFWLPATLERDYVVGLQIYNIKEGFPELYELIFPSWGTGFSGSAIEGRMSFQIGIANLLGVFLSLIFLVIYSKKKDKRFLVVAFFLCWFVLVFFLMQKDSLPLWNTIPFINYFQFPWRFLGLEILVAAFLSGAFLSVLKEKKALIFVFIMTIIGVSLSTGYIKPAYYLEREDSYYFTRPNFMDGTNTPGNIFNTVWFDRSKQKRKTNKFEIIKGTGTISEESIKSTKYYFILSSKDDVTIRVNTAYFLNWQAFVDGKKVETKRDKLGLIEFSSPEGSNKVFIKLLNTPLRTISEIVTFISFLVIFILLSISLHARMKNVHENRD